MNFDKKRFYDEEHKETSVFEKALMRIAGFTINKYCFGLILFIFLTTFLFHIWGRQDFKHIAFAVLFVSLGIYKI